MDFSTMNETDVREEIVNPLIQRLGYKHGTEHTVRREVELRYAKMILGHRKPKTDRPMRGYVDYLCDVVSYGRWTVEVKAPHVELTEAEREQAHSYAAHPEIAAAYFVLTNGRTFRLYSMLEPKQPLLEWRHEQIDQFWINLENVLGPAQIRRKFEQELRHRGKPLARDLGSVANIVGGRVEYTEYSCTDPAQSQALQSLIGTRANVETGKVARSESGLIHGQLKLAGPNEQWDLLNQLSGVSTYDFYAAEEFLSTDRDKPTILTGLIRFEMPAGTPIGGVGGLRPGLVSPFPMTMSAFTQVTGYLDGGVFEGLFLIEHEGELQIPAHIRRILPKEAATTFSFSCAGKLYVRLA